MNILLILLCWIAVGLVLGIPFGRAMAFFDRSDQPAGVQKDQVPARRLQFVT